MARRKRSNPDRLLKLAAQNIPSGQVAGQPVSPAQHSTPDAVLLSEKEASTLSLARIRQKLWVFAESPLTQGGLAVIVAAIGESLGVPALLAVGWLLLCLAIFRTEFFDGSPWGLFGNLFLFVIAAIVIFPIPRLLISKANAPVAASPLPFPNTPLQLVDFRPLKGGTLLNTSNEALFVTDVGTTTNIPGGEDSTDYPVGSAIKPHQTMSFSLPASNSTWDTQLHYKSNDWNAAAKDLTARYGQCLRPLPFLPDGALFQEVVNHYRTMQVVLPIGDSKAVIFYHRGASSKEETVQLKALLYVLQNCTVVHSGAGSSTKLPTPPQ